MSATRIAARFAALALAIQDGYAGSGARKPLRQRAAEDAAASDDDGYLAVEFKKFVHKVFD